jgi:protein gp37
VDTEFIARVFAVMAHARRHTFQLLTKRPGRMASLLGDGRFWDLVGEVAPEYGPRSQVAEAIEARRLANLWLGVSVETQKWAGVRLDKLAATSAGAVRFASCEPLLGELDLRPWLGDGLDWVIVGGESGAGARPTHPGWARSLRDQSVAAGVAFFYKQHGVFRPAGPVYRPGESVADWDERDLELTGSGCVIDPDGTLPVRWDSRRFVVDRAPAAGAWWMQRVGKKAAGRTLDGRTWDEFPAPGRAAGVSG